MIDVSSCFSLNVYVDDFVFRGTMALLISLR
jgi:hypothetical protein